MMGLLCGCCVSCSAPEASESCGGSSITALHGTFSGDIPSITMTSPAGGPANSGTAAWCYDWSPGLAEGQYIYWKGNIAWSGPVASIGLSFGFDTLATHVCGSAFDSEFPGGHCPPIRLAAAIGLGNYIRQVGPSGTGTIATAPSSGDLIEIRAVCDATELEYQFYINDILKASIGSNGFGGSGYLPNPMSYRINMTISSTATQAVGTWSNLEFGIA